MARKKKPSRFNRFSVGRAAHLFTKGASKQQVTKYYLQKYGQKWNIKTPAEMEKFLFSKTRGGRPKYGQMFEGQTPETIKQNFQQWLKKAKAHAERMRKLHQDPKFKKAHAERMRKLWADPEFKKANAERSRKRMRKLNQDPEFKKANAERMRKLHQDPEFKKAHAERSRKQMRKLNQDPEFKKANAERMRKLWADPEWRKNQRKLILIGLEKYWGNIRSNLLAELNARQLTTSYDMRTKERILATIKTPEKIVLKKEQQATVRKAIEDLPPTQRELIINRFFEEKTTKQISNETSLTTKQIEQNINSALKKLAKKLQKIL